MIMNWASLIFGSSTNFIIPLLLYVASKTYSASTTDAEGSNYLSRLTAPDIADDLQVVIY
jgi:hypothetical protein